MEQKTLSIRQISQKSGVGSKALPHWEAVGLLPKPKRTHTNYRLYTPSDLDRILFVRKAKSLGFTLSEVRKILDLCREEGFPCEEIVDWAEKKIKTLGAQIEALTQIRKRLIRYHQTWRRKGPCPPMRSDEICCLIEAVPLQEKSALLKGGDQDES